MAQIFTSFYKHDVKCTLRRGRGIKDDNRGENAEVQFYFKTEGKTKTFAPWNKVEYRPEPLHIFDNLFHL